MMRAMTDFSIRIDTQFLYFSVRASAELMELPARGRAGSADSAYR